MDLAEMREQLTDVFGPRPVETAMLRSFDTALNGVYRRLFGKRLWPWRLKQGTVALTATTIGADLPNDCSHPVCVALASTGQPMPWQALDIELLKHGDPNVVARSMPLRWDAEGRFLFTRPLSSGADTLNIWYYREFTESGPNKVKLTIPSDVPIFPTEHHQVLVDGAIARLGAVDSFDRAMRQDARRDRDDGIEAMMYTGDTAQPAQPQWPVHPEPW